MGTNDFYVLTTTREKYTGSYISTYYPKAHKSWNLIFWFVKLKVSLRVSFSLLVQNIFLVFFFPIFTSVQRWEFRGEELIAFHRRKWVIMDISFVIFSIYCQTVFLPYICYGHFIVAQVFSYVGLFSSKMWVERHH